MAKPTKKERLNQYRDGVRKSVQKSREVMYTAGKKAEALVDAMTTVMRMDMNDAATLTDIVMPLRRQILLFIEARELYFSGLDECEMSDADLQRHPHQRKRAVSRG